MYSASCVRTEINEPLAVGMQTVRIATDCIPRHQIPYEIFVCASTNTNTAKVKLNDGAPEELNLFKLKAYFTYHQLQHSEILCSAHNAFMCFAWISEQTADISLYRFNFPDFITEEECVYCAVRTGSLTHTDTVSSLKA